jgi:hypothetical protein
MKFAFPRRGQGPRSRNEAWACFTANLAWPGSGSLAAGRPVGYGQTVLALIGLLVSVVTGAHMLSWTMANRNVLNNPNSDPVANLSLIWHQIKWPLAGLGVFGIALVWAMITSAQIMAAHPKNPIPPRIV